jgi:hypothetical protein
MKKQLVLKAVLLSSILLLGFLNPSLLSNGFFTPDWEVICDQSWSRYGDGVSSGDINGDGYDDVAVGAPGYEPGGAVFIYYGSASGPSLTADKIIYGQGIGFGNRVSCSGDINNDGFYDLIVGDPWSGGIGVVRAFYGSQFGISDTADWISQSFEDENSVGYNVSTGGDVNGDRYDDLIASISYYSIDSHWIGAFVFLGSANGFISSEPAWVASVVNSSGEGSSFAVSISGDLNGDSIDDAVINGYGSGKIYVYYGSVNRQMFDPPDKVIYGNTYDFGFAAEIIKDVNGDGYDELALSDREHPTSTLYVYYGSADGPSSTYNWSHAGPGNCFAYQIRSGGDFNHDGFNDLLASVCDTTGVKMFFGSQAGLRHYETNFYVPCYNLASGDINGDGISDVISSREPRAYGFFGESEHFDTIYFPFWYAWAIYPQTELCIDVYVKNQFGLPMQGEIVDFYFFGEDTASGTGLTDNNGVATFCYEGTYPSLDTIVALSNGMSASILAYWDFPLPAEISSFSSNVSDRIVALNWSTSSELNNSGFEIQRAIENGKWKIENGKLKMENGEWDKIGFVSGGGTTNEVREYSFTDRNLETGKYKYRLKQFDFNGNFEYFELTEVVSIGIPDKYDLSQNYPNPFNPLTTINYDLPSDGIVTIKVYDILGRELKTLVNEMKTAGYHKIQFNASDLASGAYFYQMKAGDFVAVKKLVVLK